VKLYFMVDNETKLFLLSDGRQISYLEYGEKTGNPIILLHGIHHSRLMFGLIPDFPFRDDLRLIIPDRPGYGLSDFYKYGSSIIDYPKDIMELADSLSLDKFCIFGFSGGAPYALACAWKIPDRINSIGIFAGIGPLNKKSAEGIMLAMRMLYWVSHKTPVIARTVMDSLSLLVRTNFSLYEKMLYKRLTEKDKYSHSRLGPHEAIVLDRIEGFRQGGKASAYDLSLAIGWPIPLEEIVSKVYIWQGDNDRYIGEMGRYMSGILPRCDINIIPDEGHYWIIENLEDMLLTLIGE